MLGNSSCLLATAVEFAKQECLVFVAEAVRYVEFLVTFTIKLLGLYKPFEAV